MALWFDGEKIPCFAHVVDWRAQGPCRRMPASRTAGQPLPKRLVLSWTGGKDARPTKPDFSMDEHGHVFQHRDPGKAVGRVGPFAFELCVFNPGMVGRVKDPAWGRYRAQVGTLPELSMYLFNSDQVEALLEFCDALAECEIIPWRVPVQRAKGAKKASPSTLDVRGFTAAKQRDFKGVCGLFHLEGGANPGPQLLEELVDHWGL